MQVTGENDETHKQKDKSFELQRREWSSYFFNQRTAYVFVVISYVCSV